MKNNKITSVLERRVEKVLPSTSKFERFLEKKKRIRLYQGIDPTATKLHLGHTVGLRKLMEFANTGHEVILLFGTGTVLVGDPSERRAERKLITEKEIKNNIATWKEQVESIVDFNKVEIRHNGDWLLKLKLNEIIKIASNISAVQLFKREMFQRRISSGDTVWYHETMYPLLQGYDSVAMDVDLEIGGTDQEFNMLIGRELQRKINQKEKFVITVPMIKGTDGKTMSKTSKNCVWLNDKPHIMFNQLMKLIDSEIITYMKLVTNIPLIKIGNYKKQLGEKKIHPIELKKILATDVVTQFHGKSDARKALKHFESVVQTKTATISTKAFIVDERIEVENNINIIDLLLKTKMVDSKSSAKRLIVQGAVSIDNAPTTDPKLIVKIPTRFL